jgi:RNA polymerase sigma-70 factor (ECF subfamily)
MDERSSYEALLERCADKAYNFAMRLTGNDQDAQDLVQEAFARGFEHLDRYDKNRPFEAWIIRILRNVYLDAVRRYEHKHKVSLDSPPPTDGATSWTDILKGSDPEPTTLLIKSEEERLLQIGLNSLPAHYKNALVMADLEGLSYDQIAEIMKCPIGTVSSRIHQGRMLLRKAMEKLEKGSVAMSHE